MPLGLSTGGILVPCSSGTSTPNSFAAAYGCFGTWSENVTDDRLSQLTEEILKFRDERDWAQFHTPRNLAAALSIEAAELQEILLWKSDAEVAELMTDSRIAGRLREEVADVLIYGLLLCHSANIDPAQAIREKLKANAAKYPVEKARGRSTKYSDL